MIPSERGEPAAVPEGRRNEVYLVEDVAEAAANVSTADPSLS